MAFVTPHHRHCRAILAPSPRPRIIREAIYGGDAFGGSGFETIYHYSRGTALLETGRVALSLQAFEAALSLAAASAHDSASPYPALVQAKGLALLGLRRFRSFPSTRRQHSLPSNTFYTTF